MRDLRQPLDVFQAAEEVRLLHQHASRVVAHRVEEILRRDDAGRRADGRLLDIQVVQIRRKRLPVFGMHAGGRDDVPVAPVALMLISTASVAAVAPSYRLALATSMPVSRLINV